jgi:hypothetical protein
MEFLRIWPGTKILLVFGEKALQSVYSQANPVAHLKNVVVIPYLDKSEKMHSIYNLYGGDPILVVNAEQHTYCEMSELHQNEFGIDRVVCVTPDFPYWHHSFKIEEKPFGFFVVDKDNASLNLFCSVCLRHVDITQNKTLACKHPLCETCALEANPICLHAHHKREYISYEYNEECMEFLEGVSITYCTRGGCEGIVDPRVVCTECFEGGFCSQQCLVLNHDC